MSGQWQCEPLNPKPQNPQHSEHVVFVQTWGQNGLGQPETFQVVPNHSRSVLPDELSSGLGQPETFQVVPNRSVISLTTCRAVWDNLKRFRSSRTT